MIRHNFPLRVPSPDCRAFGQRTSAPGVKLQRQRGSKPGYDGNARNSPIEQIRRKFSCKENKLLFINSLSRCEASAADSPYREISHRYGEFRFLDMETRNSARHPLAGAYAGYLRRDSILLN